MNRRSFLKLSAAMGGGALLASKLQFLQRAFAQYVAQNTLDPTLITQFAAPMVIPPAMPRTSKIKVKGGKNIEYFEIGVKPGNQQILPSTQFGPTPVWSYYSVNHPLSWNYPAFTIEARWQKPVRVKWINQLDGQQHLLPVDPTLHWANPIGMRDMRPMPTNTGYWSHPYISASENGAYTGPVPIVTHVHGAHTHQESDGYPEAWYLPASSYGDTNIMHSTGTYYDIFIQNGVAPWGDGYAVFEYPNDQRATTLWYHDHTLGMTRLNVYAGPAGFYILRGGPDDMVTDMATGLPAVLPGPAPALGDPPGLMYYEIPIAIQDRSFDEIGNLWYPLYRAFFEGLESEQLQIPFIPDETLASVSGAEVYSDVSPIWQPEFFGNVMVVNGVSWPFLNVEPQLYRFRLLNGCNSRFLILQFDPAVPVWQIGAEGGFLPTPVDIATNTPYPGMILMALAERADVIVDFRGLAPGATVRLLNFGPDEPFGGGEIGSDFPSADPATTGQVMEFRVVAPGAMSAPPNAFTEPASLVLPPIVPLVATAPARQVSLNEEESKTVLVPVNANGDFVLDTNGTLWEVASGETPTETSSGVWELIRLAGVTWAESWMPGAFGPTSALLGTLNPDGSGNPMLWMDPITENPAVGSTEMWEIHNFTMDAHPIHIHLVQFQVVGRYQPDGTLIGGPEPAEMGFKDTVIAYPDQVTKVIARFDISGRFVWHCHIVEHEDNEMMRPYVVG